MSRTALSLISGAVVIAAVWFGPALLGGTEAGGHAADLFHVKPGPLRITVTESAELYAGKSTTLRSQIEGRAAILSLITEGEEVKKGDKLAELDVSSIKDRFENQEITVSRAKASFITADKNVEIQKNQNASDREGAEMNVLFAELELEKFLGKARTATTVKGNHGNSTNGNGSDQNTQMGELDQKLVKARNDIRLAEEELKRAKDRLDWTEKLFDKEYVTKNDLDADRLKVLQSENRLDLSKNELYILETYTLPKTRKELQLKVKESTAELTRTRLRGEAKLATQVADLESKTQQLSLERARLTKYREQIAASIIRAPTDGLVVYAQVGDRRRSNREPIDVGTEVRESQSLIILPDLTTMKVKTSIHEAHVDKVSYALRQAKGGPGPAVTMKIDALPNRVFFGRVTRVAVVPDSNSSWFSSDVRLYSTRIELEGNTDELRPGQSASVEIEVAHLKNVLTVPVQAVHRTGRVLYVWMRRDGVATAVPVETGMASDQFVVVVEGVAAGDVIYLSRPDGAVEPAFKALNAKRETETKENEAKQRSSAPINVNTQRPERGPANAGVPTRGARGERRGSRGGERAARGGEGAARGGRQGGSRSGGGRRGGMSPEQRAQSTAFFAAAKKRFPAMTDARALFSDAELRKKVLGDPQLNKEFPEVIKRYKQMMERFGNRAGGQRGAGNRGGNRGGGERR